MLDQYQYEKQVREVHSRAKIDEKVKGNAEALRRVNLHQSAWILNLYPEAGKASGSFRASHRQSSGNPFIINLEIRTTEEITTARPHPQEEADRCAKRQIRRYCAYNRLNHLVTLTFEGEGCHDQ